MCNQQNGYSALSTRSQDPTSRYFYNQDGAIVEDFGEPTRHHSGCLEAYLAIDPFKKIRVYLKHKSNNGLYGTNSYFGETEEVAGKLLFTDVETTTKIMDPIPMNTPRLSNSYGTGTDGFPNSSPSVAGYIQKTWGQLGDAITNPTHGLNTAYNNADEVYDIPPGALMDHAKKTSLMSEEENSKVIFVPTKPGIYKYVCASHPDHMKGVIRVI
jgi:hypothetical protein